MCGYCVKCGDIGKAKLAECILKNRDAGLGGCRRVRSGVYGLDDFVDLGRNEGIWKSVSWPADIDRMTLQGIPGSSRRYNFSALATMGISYRSRISRGMALPVLMELRR